MRVSGTERSYYLLQVSRSQSRIGIRDEDDAVFSLGESGGYFDRFSEALAEVSAAARASSGPLTSKTRPSMLRGVSFVERSVGQFDRFSESFSEISAATES